MPTHVLVLAATGTTGRHTIHALGERGARLRAATRSPDTAAFAPEVDTVRFALDEPSTWAPALASVHAVYLAMPAFRPDEADVGAAFVAAARDAGVRRIVKLSGMGAENLPDSGHRRVELAIEQSGLEWIHLRPNFFMDNFVNFYGASIRANATIALPAGDQPTSFVAASDIGRAAATALLGQETGAAWTLTGSEALTHAEVARRMTAVLGKTVTYVDIPPEQFTSGLRDSGMPELSVEAMGMLYHVIRSGWAAPVVDDLAEAIGQAPLGFDAWLQAHERELV